MWSIPSPSTIQPEKLRLGDGYKSHRQETFFQFPDDQGSLSEATLRCVGVGACRKQGPGTMCPSYMATQEEKHSTRGRAHLLWEMLEGDILATATGRARPFTKRSTCASPAKPAKPSAPSTSTSLRTRPNSSPTTIEGHRHALRHYAFGFMDQVGASGVAYPRHHSASRQSSACTCPA